MATVEERLAAVEQQLAVINAERETLRRRLSWWKGASVFTLLLGLFLGYPQVGQAQGTVEERLAALEFKLAPLTRMANDLIFTGVNLHLRNGQNDTQRANGLGNLIIGYNEERGEDLDERTGSHNLVLGQGNNYTSYGGIIGGYQNTISGPFAHVLTGYHNGALSFNSCVTTGQANNAANQFASVSGGANNTASGPATSVSGGFLNTASAQAASVSSGAFGTASGTEASVSGGSNNTASGQRASMSGGFSRTAGGQFDWAAGSLSEDQ